MPMNEELKKMGSEELRELYLSLPKESDERARIFKYYLGGELREEPTKIKETKKGTPIFKVNRIACVNNNKGKGYSECLLDAEGKTYEIKNVDIVGILEQKVLRHVIDPNGLLLDIEPTDIYPYGNAIVDTNVRGLLNFEPGMVVTIREAIMNAQKKKLSELHEFDWSPRKTKATSRAAERASAEF